MNEQQRIRALILQEYQADRTSHQAHANICRELGSNAVSKVTVDQWYENFEAGNFNLRDENDPDYDEPLTIGANVYLKANKSVLFRSNDVRFLTRGTTDGRFGFYHPGNWLMVADFYHGQTITFSVENRAPMPPSLRRFSILDDSRILSLEIADIQDEQRLLRISLIDIDFNKRKSHVTTQIEKQIASSYFRALLVDQSNTNMFGIFTEAGYILGEIQGNGVSIGDHQLNDIGRGLFCTKLDGTNLYGFRHSDRPNRFQFLKHDLQTSSTQIIEIPSVLDNGEQLGHEILFCTHAWAGPILYVNWKDADTSTYFLDTNTRVWSKLKFAGIADVRMMCVSGDVLTVQSGGFKNGKYDMTFHRFPLRHPDSLVNLAWFAAQYYHNFRGSGIFERLRKRLPYNTHLRCPFPDDA